MLDKPDPNITHSEVAERRRYLLSQRFVDPGTMRSFAEGWSAGLSEEELALALMIGADKRNNTIAEALDVSYDESRALVERLKRRLRRRSKAAIAFIVCLDNALYEIKAHGIPQCEHMWSELRFPGTTKERFAILSERERQMVHMIVQGIPSEEMAAMLVATKEGLRGELREVRQHLGATTIQGVAALYAKQLVLDTARWA